jgi:hypothetical protein
VSHRRYHDALGWTTAGRYIAQAWLVENSIREDYSQMNYDPFVFFAVAGE